MHNKMNFRKINLVMDIYACLISLVCRIWETIWENLDKDVSEWKSIPHLRIVPRIEI